MNPLKTLTSEIVDRSNFSSNLLIYIEERNNFNPQSLKSWNGSPIQNQNMNFFQDFSSNRHFSRYDSSKASIFVCKSSSKPTAEYKIEKHSVQKNEVAVDIASTHGITVKELEALNPEIDVFHLSENQILTVPNKPIQTNAVKSRNSKNKKKYPKVISQDEAVCQPLDQSNDTETYIIQRREWVALIAANLGTTIDELRRLNPNVDLDHVRAKQRLIVPRQRFEFELKSELDLIQSRNNLSKPVPSICPPQVIHPEPVDSTDSLNLNTCDAKFETSDSAVSEEIQPVPKVRSTNQTSRSVSSDVATQDYTVLRGDRVDRIAEKWGIDLQKLQEINPNLKIDSVKSGNVIQIPVKVNRNEIKGGYSAANSEESSNTEYMVEAGDTLRQIASMHGVRMQEIITLNRLDENKPIVGGQMLLIPPATSSERSFQKSRRSQTSQTHAFPFYLPPGSPSQTLSIAAGMFSASVITAVLVYQIRKQFQFRKKSSLSDETKALNKTKIASETGTVTNLSSSTSPSPSLTFTNQISERFRKSKSPLEEEREMIFNMAELSRKFPSKGSIVAAHASAVDSSLSNSVQVAYAKAIQSLPSTSDKFAVMIIGGDSEIERIESKKERKKEKKTNSDEEVKGDKEGEGERESILNKMNTFFSKQNCNLLGVSVYKNLNSSDYVPPFASVFLFSSPEIFVSVVSPVTVNASSNDSLNSAIEFLSSRINDKHSLKSIVAIVTGGLENLVMDEVTNYFPNLSIYIIAPGESRNYKSNQWQIPKGDFSSPGISLLGISKEADFSGAFLASILGQWLFGSDTEIISKPASLVRK